MAIVGRQQQLQDNYKIRSIIAKCCAVSSVDHNIKYIKLSKYYKMITNKSKHQLPSYRWWWVNQKDVTARPNHTWSTEIKWLVTTYAHHFSVKHVEQLPVRLTDGIVRVLVDDNHSLVLSCVQCLSIKIKSPHCARPRGHMLSWNLHPYLTWMNKESFIHTLCTLFGVRVWCAREQAKDSRIIGPIHRWVYTAICISCWYHKHLAIRLIGPRRSMWMRWCTRMHAIIVTTAPTICCCVLLNVRIDKWNSVAACKAQVMLQTYTRWAV